MVVTCYYVRCVLGLDTFLTGFSFVDYRSNEFYDHRCVLYAQMFFTALHALQTQESPPDILCFNQSCLAEGMSRYLELPIYHQVHATNAWRMFSISTARKFQSSLGSFLPIFMACVVASMRAGGTTSLEELFLAAQAEYLALHPEIAAQTSTLTEDSSAPQGKAAPFAPAPSPEAAPSEAVLPEVAPSEPAPSEGALSEMAPSEAVPSNAPQASGEESDPDESANGDIFVVPVDKCLGEVVFTCGDDAMRQTPLGRFFDL